MIDNLNWSILKHLQANARMSNSEIGRRVGGGPCLLIPRPIPTGGGGGRCGETA